MSYNDAAKNPLNYILPAGVVAYIASPEVRKTVRKVLVRGIAEALELTEKASGLTENLRKEYQTLKADAEKLREEEAQPPVTVQIHSDEPGPEGAPA